MRICYFGTYERNYVRNRTIIDGLRQYGWEVQECHVPLWERERNKTGKYLGFISLFLRGFQILIAYVRLLFQYLMTVHRYDVMIVGYIGHLDLPLAWLLTRFPRRLLVFDPLISMYDTLAEDRAIFPARSWMGRILWYLDRVTCRAADLVLLDTNAHIGYFVKTLYLPRDKFVRVFVGAEDRIFVPHSKPEAPKSGDFRVVFIGKFTPLHGLQTILQAAKHVEDDPVVFDIIGSGQLSEEIHHLATRLDLSNTRFTDWVEYTALPDRLVRADVCLGIFGTTAKAARVIPAKVFTALAMRKPLITGDSPAIRELLEDDKHVVLCQRGDPESLSQAIQKLRSDSALLQRVAEGGHRVYRERASEEQIGRTVAGAIESLVLDETAA